MKVVPRCVLRHRIRREETLMWLLLQSLVFAVVGTNIHWHWTENIYLPAILGWLAALLVTVGLNGLIDLFRRRASSAPPVLVASRGTAVNFAQA